LVNNAAYLNEKMSVRPFWLGFDSAAEVMNMSVNVGPPKRQRDNKNE
jgi:hypothetical protein